METKMDANMIAYMGTNLKNINREMYAIVERTIKQAGELEKLQNEQSSRHLPSNTNNDDIWESESTSVSLEEEFLNLALDEDKITMK